MQPEHHADQAKIARLGLIRGVLVIVTAVALGAFVLSRAAFDESSVETAAGALSAEGTDGDDLTDDSGTATTVGSASSETAVDPNAAAPVDGSPATTVAGVGEVTTSSEPAGPAISSPADVQVMVLNAEGTKGVAGRGSEVLRAAGYTVLAPKNATKLASVSSILYTANFNAEAEAVAAAFGQDALIVAALDPVNPPIADLGAAMVVVVVGQDGALGI